MEKSKILSFILKVRVYGLKFDSNVSHSYLVDDVPSGCSSVIGEFVVDIRLVNLTKMRKMIQYDRNGHMDRRSMLFQEALFLMRRFPNYFDRPESDWNKYQFGFLRKDNDQLTLIDEADEEKPISDLIGVTEFFDYDLAIVPLTQIPPT